MSEINSQTRPKGWAANEEDEHAVGFDEQSAAAAADGAESGEGDDLVRVPRHVQSVVHMKVGLEESHDVLRRCGGEL